jgi:hypothetical protein
LRPTPAAMRCASRFCPRGRCWPATSRTRRRA